VTTLLVNAHVVTMNDEGTEHDDGWILLADGLVSNVGAGPRPEADGADRLYIGGEEVARDGQLVWVDEQAIAKEHRHQAERFAS
jgi:hypothetical protein